MAVLLAVAGIGLSACAPGRPTAPTAIAGDGSVALAWVAPTTGGKEITSYVVTTKVGGSAVASQQVAAPATSTVVPGLTNGTAYTFTVAALNADGRGPDAPESAEVTPVAGGWTDPNNQVSMAAAWRSIMAASPASGSTADIATCKAGTTSAAYRQAQLDAVNGFRAVAGVPAATENTTYSAQAQAAALIMAAQGSLSHDPPTSWPCWTQTGRDAASSSNLHIGVDAGTYAIRSYVGDAGTNNTKVGHRRWILCPASRSLGFGDVGTANATKIMPANDTFSSPSDTRDGFVAWPSRGLYPLNLDPSALHDRQSVMVPRYWSVAGANVTISASAGGPVTTNIIERDDAWYCSSAAVWTTSRQPAVGETWTVTVSGLKDSNGATRSFTWATTYTNL